MAGEQDKNFWSLIWNAEETQAPPPSFGSGAAEDVQGHGEGAALTSGSGGSAEAGSSVNLVQRRPQELISGTDAEDNGEVADPEFGPITFLEYFEQTRQETSQKLDDVNRQLAQYSNLVIGNPTVFPISLPDLEIPPMLIGNSLSIAGIASVDSSPRVDIHAKTDGFHQSANLTAEHCECEMNTVPIANNRSTKNNFSQTENNEAYKVNLCLPQQLYELNGQINGKQPVLDMETRRRNGETEQAQSGNGEMTFSSVPVTSPSPFVVQENKGNCQEAVMQARLRLVDPPLMDHDQSHSCISYHTKMIGTEPEGARCSETESPRPTGRALKTNYNAPPSTFSVHRRLPPSNFSCRGRGRPRKNFLRQDSPPIANSSEEGLSGHTSSVKLARMDAQAGHSDQSGTSGQIKKKPGWRPSTGNVSRHSPSSNPKSGRRMGRPKNNFPLDCIFCGKIFPEKRRLEEHINWHTGERPFNCEMCGETFYQKRVLDQHGLSHAPEKRYQCSKCGQMFTLSGHLNYHVSHMVCDK